MTSWLIFLIVLIGAFCLIGAQLQDIIDLLADLRRRVKRLEDSK